MHLRKLLGNGGPRPGPFPLGKNSTEIRYRSESCLREIRNPQPVNVKHRLGQWRLLRGDLVAVVSGAERGKRGRVLEVVRKSNALVVEGVNMRTVVVTRPDGKKETIRTEAPVEYGKVNIVCPTTGRPTRMAMRFLENGRKVRVSKRSGEVIPRPEILAKRRVPVPVVGPKDVGEAVAHKKTLDDEGVGIAWLARDLNRMSLLPEEGDVVGEVKSP